MIIAEPAGAFLIAVSIPFKEGYNSDLSYYIICRKNIILVLKKMI